MRLNGLIGAALAASLVASPVLAAEGSASSLSVVRTSAPISQASALQDDEGGTSWLLLGAAAVAAGVAIYFLVDSDDDEDESTSP